MAGVTITATADTSILEAAIPRIVAFGSRTMAEQCVTSATFIALNAKDYTIYASIPDIDAGLDEMVTVVAKNRKGQLVKNRMTRGQSIILARMNPDSDYNAETGGRWAMTRPDFNVSGIGRAGRGSSYFMLKQRDKRAMWDFINNALERMRSARHSSTHYLQSAWVPAIRQGIANENYRYNPAFGTRKQATANPSTLIDSKNLDPEHFGGGLTIELSGDSCVVTGENLAGENEGRSNAVLAAKHRAALIEYGLPALQLAIEFEVFTLNREVQRRLELEWPVKFPELL